MIKPIPTKYYIQPEPDNSNTTILKTVVASQEIANSIMDQLNIDTERLNNVEDKLDDIKEINKESKYVLRNMTWCGWFLNKFRHKPNSITKLQDNPQDNITNISTINTHSKERNREKNHNTSTVPVAKKLSEDINYIHHINSNPPLHQSLLLSEEKELQEISSTLSTLHNSSVIIGNTLDTHTEQLTRIDDKSHGNVRDIERNNRRIRNLL